LAVRKENEKKENIKIIS